MPRKSGRSVRFSWRSNERARFQCAFDNINTFFDCGEGFESDLQSNNLRRNGLHSLYVRGTDDYGNVGEVIRAEWTVGLYSLLYFCYKAFFCDVLSLSHQYKFTSR